MSQHMGDWWGDDSEGGKEGGSGGREGGSGGELTLPIGVQPQCRQLLEQCPSAMFQW